jgi:hypothetical protein
MQELRFVLPTTASARRPRAAPGSDSRPSGPPSSSTCALGRASSSGSSQRSRPARAPTPLNAGPSYVPLDLCRKQGAVLVIAKLDRLGRNVHFVTGLIESGVDFVAADMPHATKVMIQIHAVMAEHERDQISARTKAALAAAKARGVKLGVTGPANLRPNLEARQEAARRFAERMRPVFEGFKLRGLSQRQIVAELNALGVKAARGGIWRLKQVQRVVGRIEQHVIGRLIAGD